MSRRWRRTSTPSIRRSYGYNIASMAWNLYAIEQTQRRVDGVKAPQDAATRTTRDETSSVDSHQATRRHSSGLASVKTRRSTPPRPNARCRRRRGIWTRLVTDRRRHRRAWPAAWLQAWSCLLELANAQSPATPSSASSATLVARTELMVAEAAAATTLLTILASASTSRKRLLRTPLIKSARIHFVRRRLPRRGVVW